MNMVKILFICQGASGTMRAIWLVFVGTSIVGALSPRNAPAKTSGAEMQTQSKKSTTPASSGPKDKVSLSKTEEKPRRDFVNKVFIPSLFENWVFADLV